MLYPAYRALSNAIELIPGPWRDNSLGIPPLGSGVVHGVIHGASAGEVVAARALRSALREQGRSGPWAVSTGTTAGIRCGADFLLPRDLPRQTAGLFDRSGLESLILIESELWPNLLFEAERREVPVGVAGARVSAPSYQRMSLLPKTVLRLLQTVQAFAAASETDACRLRSLGVPPERIKVCGWLKWPERGQMLRREDLVVGLDQPPASEQALFVLGSVYPGEPTAIARALQGGALEPGRAHWLLVARHRRHRTALLKEARALCPPGSFTLDDRFGVLNSWYGQADAAFVGGGLSGRGCHNLLEALAAGLRPLCFAATEEPESVARVLAQSDFALPLDEPNPRSSAQLTALACSRALGGYESLKRTHDGRGRSVRFLSAQGVVT